MSWRRRSVERRSLSSARWSMADSLSICAIGEGSAHLRRPLELEPVSGALEHLQPVIVLDVSRRGLHGAAAERGILVAPKQMRGRVDRTKARQPLPCTAAWAEVGSVVVERGRKTAGAARRARELLDHRAGH